MKNWRGGMRKMAVLALACALAGPALAADYGHYLLGDPAAKTPGTVRPGLLLMGGGDRNHDALRWFMDKAGHGHIVVLRASQGGQIGEEFFNEVGGIASVETFVFKDREAASDPAVLRALERADGIFIAGGDQSRYVRWWRGTPVAAALDAHVRAGKPLGGTSAGLAMLGEHVYGAMDGGSQTSPRALADPLGPDNTIETGFLHLDLLRGVVTDTHFSERGRLGRLLAFVAKAEHQAGGTPVIGLGVDEDAALAVEGDGRARVYATAPGAGATVVPGGLAKQAEDRPMELAQVEVTGVGTGSVLHLPGGRVDRPSFRRTYAVRDGVLVAKEWPLLVIHGGAGVERAGLSAEEEAAARAALAEALRAGHAALKTGSSATDAVTAAIAVLEDAPQFNAGRGAVFTHDGKNELDASIMEGATGKAGAIAGVRRVRHPILLARAVMDHSRHVMMVGDGAEAFAKEQGLELVDPSWFRTEKRWQQLQKALAEEKAQASKAPQELPGKAYFGTVGALALDAQGRLAAGTSTGGMTNKRYGRVGDAPIIGAGTWADARCAFSGTGWGEYYIRAAAAHEVCARVRLLGQPLAKAAHEVINVGIPKAGGDGGAIALGADGSLAFPFNTEGMYRGWIGADGVPHVAVFADEDLPLP